MSIDDPADDSGAFEYADAKASKQVICPRCECEKQYLGTKRLKDGAQFGIFGELAQVFVNREKFDVYACPKCGSVEFFVDGVGEKHRPQ